MTPEPKHETPGRPERPAAVAEDPLAEVTNRKLSAEVALSKAARALSTAKVAVSNAATTETGLAKQKKELDALHERARRVHEEAVKRADALEVIRAYAETDLAIAKLELELRVANLQAAAPEAEAKDSAAAAAASERLAREKELREYDAHQRKAGKAQEVIDKIDADNQRIARAAALEKTQADIAGQLKRKEQDRARLAETAKKVSDETASLAKRLKEIEAERKALASGR